MKLALLFIIAGIMLAFSIVACKSVSQPETAPADWEVLSEVALNSSHGKISFATHVKPILEAKCFVCHNGQTPGFFSLENRAHAFKAGTAGPLIVPRHPEKSAMVQNATTAHARTMPPVGERMTADEKRIIIAWVEQGAQWPKGNDGELHPFNVVAH